jgi:hypothetical protein
MTPGCGTTPGENDSPGMTTAGAAVAGGATVVRINGLVAGCDERQPTSAITAQSAIASHFMMNSFCPIAGGRPQRRLRALAILQRTIRADLFSEQN